MGFSFFQVDAFTDRPFHGNPAAVFVLPEAQNEAWMQDIAAEINLSETAFLHLKDKRYTLRWFTPLHEVDLCGHATLASAHILWQTGILKADQEAHFDTRSGALSARRIDQWIELDFPTEPAQEIVAPPPLNQALGVSAQYIGANRMDILVEVDSEKTLRALAPDFALLETLKTRGIIVTSRSNTKDFDFISRFFAPRSGIKEDSVTGSAHCCLGPFWQARLGKNELIAYQASARGGIVKLRVAGPRVYIRGQAVTVFSGAWGD